MKRIVTIALTLIMMLSLGVTAFAAETASGTTLRVADSSGTVTIKDSAGKKKTVKEGLKLYSGYTITTGTNSYMYISLDNTKVVKLGSSGKVELKKSGKKLEVELTAGQLFFNVTEPLKTDESLNIRTSTMVTGVRGSFGWVSNEQVGLMHGHVTLTCSDPNTGVAVTAEVFSGEKVSLDAVAAAAAAAGEAQQQQNPTNPDQPQQTTQPVAIGEAFIKESIVNEDVPAIVIQEVVKDETLQTQLHEDVKTIEVVELVESLPDKIAEETAKEVEAVKEVEAAVATQTEEIAIAVAEDKTETKLDLRTVEKQEIIPEPAKEEEAPIVEERPEVVEQQQQPSEPAAETKPVEEKPAQETSPSTPSTSSGGGGGGASGGGSDYTPSTPSDPTPVQPSEPSYEETTVTNASELQTALDKYKKVIFTGNNEASQLASVIVAQGKTLVIGNGTTDCTLYINGRLMNSGDIIVENKATLKLGTNANTTNRGVITNKGKVINDGEFNNYGTLTTEGDI